MGTFSALKKLAVTMGDPSGVGCEIIRKWADAASDETLRCVEVIGHKKFLDTLPRVLSKRAVGSETFEAGIGYPCEEGSRVAFESLEAAARGCIEGRYAGVTTAPISKFEMKKVGFDFAGHTEFFADRWAGIPVMCFAGERLLMSLATWHIALKDVATSICRENLSRAVKSCAELVRGIRGIEIPRMGICGLNPHAGEDGLMGREEIETINPILDELRESSPVYSKVSRALPPDTVFARELKGEFDCCVALYHDQGLGPLKALEFDSAVNVTMNLKYVRTSPDHGTGYSIAGRGIASEKSLAHAIDLAFLLCRARR